MNVKMSIMALVVPAFLSSTSIAAEGSSMELGKELFGSPKLGSNGKSCSDCHHDGKGLQKAASYDADQLGDIVNQCIKGPLEGNGLNTDSIEMKSIIVYIKSLGDNGKGKVE